MKFIVYILIILASALTYCVFNAFQKMYSKRLELFTYSDVIRLFPTDKDAVEGYTQAAIENAKTRLEMMYKVKPNKRTFKNTVDFFDLMLNDFTIVSSAMSALMYASPDETVRTAAQQAMMKLQAFSVDHFSHNPQLYACFADYEKLFKTDAAQLNDVQRYAFEELMHDFRRNGLQKSPQEQEQIKKLQKELDEHSLKFDFNISSSQKSIEVDKEDLAGLDADFINGLQKTKEGKYILGTDYPTNTKVLENCSVAKTRKAQYKAFMQRGYPANEQELITVIGLRDQLAKLLGYPSYAHYDIANQMAKSPECVKTFLSDIITRAHVKNDQEIALLKKHLPESVELTKDGKMYPWDIQFMRNEYKKNNLAIDENKISEYFPLDATLPALLSIYEQFFGIQFKPVEQPELWHKDARMLVVYKNGTFLGYLILDLFPRPFKYTHAGELGVVQALKMPNGKTYPGVTIVLTNFPKPQGDKPALWRRQDVITFFHEAGHALHDLLGGTELASFSGTHTKGDFLEMPSQMLEEWMWDPAIIKKVSSHYKTKEPLPDELIEKILTLKNFESGEGTVRQVYYATICLQYFLPGEHKDVAKMWKEYHESMRPHIYYDEDNKGYCSFTHLMGYGAKYYGYLWSKVFALDLFYYIKPHGLLNRAIGERYVREVISLGGSKDPAILLENFLGRKPNSDAFFKDLGL